MPRAPRPSAADPTLAVAYLRTSTEDQANGLDAQNDAIHRYARSCPSAEAYLCNWSDVLVGRWGGMEILASNVAGDAFAKNMTWVRIIGEFDVALRHPESCVYATGITA